VSGGVIIPLAELAGGRAAQVRVEAPGTGDAVAQFGQRLGQIGEAMETDRLDREMVVARSRIQRDLGQLALEMEGIGDPDALDAAWVERSGALRAQSMAGVDPRNRARVEASYDELANGYTLRIGARALEGRNSAWRAALDEQTNAYVGAAAGSDRGSRDAGLQELTESVADGIASGRITPEQGGDILRRAAAEGEQAAVLRHLEADPAGVVAALDRGEYEGLDPVYAENVRIKAANDIAAASVEAERQAKVASDAIGDELGEIRDIFAAGRMPSAGQLALLSDARAQDRPEFAETMAAGELMRDRGAILSAPPAEIAAMIQEERAQPIVRKWQNERLKVLEGAFAKANEGWGKDPIAMAASVGMAVPDLPDFDAAAPGGFVRALRDRAAYARSTIEGEGYARVAIPLTLDEQAVLKEAAGLERDPAERVALAGTLGGVLGPDAAAAIAGDEVFGHVSGLLADGGSAGVAREVFRGQQAIEAETVVMPSRADRLGPTFAQVGNLFADVDGGEMMQGAVQKAADALYAARVRRQPAGTDIDEVVYRQAVHEVLGGTGVVDPDPRKNNKDVKGGIQTVRGELTALPAGVGAADVEVALGKLGRRTLDKGDRRGVAAAAQNVSDDAFLAGQLAAMSRDGAAPEIAGVPVTVRDLAHMTLRAIGGGEYMMLYQGEKLTLPDGQTWRFTIPGLLREAAR